MRVLYIGGAGRSGSTLLDRMLGALPGVSALGEVVNLWGVVRLTDDYCACGRSYARCDFWVAVGDKAFGGWDQIDLGRVRELRTLALRLRNVPALVGGRLGPRLRGQLAEYAAYTTAVYAAAASLTGAELVVDSSKVPAIALCLRRAAGSDLRMVHLVRDPRGVAYSWTKVVPRLESNVGQTMPRFPPVRSALSWDVHNLGAALAGRSGRPAGRAPEGLPVKRLHYEHLVSDPQGTIRGIGAFVGLDVGSDDLAFLTDDHVNLPVHHMIGGNPMRFRTGRLPLRRDDVWRTALPRRHRRLVTALCAPLLVAYGYPLRTRLDE
ncbi:sulfotransferase [Plantactinospora siamensis]|uniref:Sulfotransferase n=1 Tax=Plantactinospora siamensis TaxID=555372 RepID=A0ABV6P6A6_9ACTN